jgi:hypothetical protein
MKTKSLSTLSLFFAVFAEFAAILSQFAAVFAEFAAGSFQGFKALKSMSRF